MFPSQEGTSEMQLGEDAPWDPQRRVKELEAQGVMAEVLFTNGAPFAAGRIDFAPDPEQTRQANMAFNRWVLDFCSEAPGRLHGQALVSFDDVDQAVKDVHWAREQGLVGILMPPLYPGSRFFFDPALDPIWAACVETGMPLSQHDDTDTEFVPHSDNARLMAAMPKVTEDDARKVLFENAAKVYQLDLDALQPTFEQVAFELAEPVPA